MSYIVKCVRETGTITYHCSTTRTALDKVQDFQRAEYSGIKIATSDDDWISESKLASLATLEPVRSIVA